MTSTAMALRSIGGNVGRIGGNQVVGYIIEVSGLAASVLVVSALLITALLLLCCVQSPAKAGKKKAADQENPSISGEILGGFKMALGDPAFMSMLGVTVTCNVFYWSHLPILQVLHADASKAGLLVSASGWGGLLPRLRSPSSPPGRRASSTASVPSALSWCWLWPSSRTSGSPSPPSWHLASLPGCLERFSLRSSCRWCRTSFGVVRSGCSRSLSAVPLSEPQHYM